MERKGRRLLLGIVGIATLMQVIRMRMNSTMPRALTRLTGFSTISSVRQWKQTLRCER